MPSCAALIQQDSIHAWLFIPSAIFLGALHGLEPGHSKTMMAAFIVAIRGTFGQAILLCLAATVSHTLIVWGIALGGLYFWRGLDAETIEPYFQLTSAAIIIGIALWMLWRIWQDQKRAEAASGHHHGHGTRAHAHDHVHGLGHNEEVRPIDTGHGVLALEIFETGAPPGWRLRSESGFAWAAKDVTIETEYADGRRLTFSFADRGDYVNRGRDAHYWAPPAQNRTGGIPAYGSHLGCLTRKR